MLTQIQPEPQDSSTPCLALFRAISLTGTRRVPAPGIESILNSSRPSELPGNVPGWNAAPESAACRTLICGLTRAVPHGSFL